MIIIQSSIAGKDSGDEKIKLCMNIQWTDICSKTYTTGIPYVQHFLYVRRSYALDFKVCILMIKQIGTYGNSDPLGHT